jgi:dihydrofolate synthase/folylpolyglutamate synthase
MAATGASALARWLAWLDRLHASEIELGLERVGRVAHAMGVDQPAARTILVGGTNGKGSVVTHLEQLLTGHGYTVGAYTSPHLVHFRERIRIDGRESHDDTIIAALERVEAARGATPLTFFEYTTLAALAIFRAAHLDYALLEVGLGGRLDATNVVDPDLALVTPIGLDHAEYLGPDRDTIGAEKAGIARPDRPLLVGERQPPAGLVDTARALGASVECIGDAFEWTTEGDTWRLSLNQATVSALPRPGIGGSHAIDNAAMALAAWDRMGGSLAPESVRTALTAIAVPGRFEVRPGRPEVILDVAHNREAAVALAESLAQRSVQGTTSMVLGAYADKDIAGLVSALAGQVEHWYPASLAPPRGAEGETLAGFCRGTGARVADPAPDPSAALERALADCEPDGRVVVAGSFATVAAVRGDLDTEPPSPRWGIS